MIAVCFALLSGLAGQDAAPMPKEVRFPELARVIRDLKGQVVVVDIWHRT